MRHRLLNYAIPVGAVVIGILGGVLPPPSLPFLWAVGILDALLAAWFLVYTYGWARASVYALIAVVFSFSAEYTLISVGLLTHLTAPQLAGVAAINLLQDFFAVTSPYLFACALLPSGGVLARALGAAVIMLVTTFVAGPFPSTLGYYAYNAPFLAWGKVSVCASPPCAVGRTHGNVRAGLCDDDRVCGMRFREGRKTEALSEVGGPFVFQWAGAAWVGLGRLHGTMGAVPARLYNARRARHFCGASSPCC